MLIYYTDRSLNNDNGFPQRAVITRQSERFPSKVIISFGGWGGHTLSSLSGNHSVDSVAAVIAVLAAA